MFPAKGILISDEKILEELRKASEGLFVISESDYPLEVIRWDGRTAITPEYLCSISGAPAGSSIKEVDVDTFFNLNEKFREVSRVLKNNLSGARVYKVGSINIAVYIVGRSPEGNWLGLSTRLVQT